METCKRCGKILPNGWSKNFGDICISCENVLRLAEVKRLRAENERLYNEIGDTEALKVENERLRDALRQLRNDAIVLSDEYLSTFYRLPDKETVHGFILGDWRKLANTVKVVDAGLGNTPNKPDVNAPVVVS